jgi:hypothetical protein
MSKLKGVIDMLDKQISKVINENFDKTPVIKIKTASGEKFIVTKEQLVYLINNVKHLQEKCNVKEEKVRIPVEKEGVLAVPEGKKVNELPYSHFLALAKKKGFPTIIRSLNNLHVWNRKTKPSLSSWADSMQNKISAAYEKEKEKKKEK